MEPTLTNNFNTFFEHIFSNALVSKMSIIYNYKQNLLLVLLKM